MGCAHSKLPRQLRRAEESAPVAHCRDRSALLAEAIRRRYELADAHRAYAASLRAAGAGLHDFLRAVQDAAPPPPPPTPQQPRPATDVRLPARRKRAGAAPARVDADGVGEDGGHIQFPPDEDDDVDDGHIVFPPEEEGSSSDDGHIVFPAEPDEEEAETAEEPAAAEPDEAEDEEPEGEEEDPPVPVVPEEPMIQPAPPARPPPLQMAAPYGHGYPPPPYTYAPPTPYTYGPDPGASSSYGGGYGPNPGPSYAYSSGYVDGADTGGGGYGYNLVSSVNYARSEPPSPAFSYEHHPQVNTGNVVHHQYQHDGADGRPTPTSSYYGGYPYQYPLGTGGFSSPVAAAASSDQPPATPSPPRAPTWDLLNPFETFQNYYPELPVAMVNNYTSTIRSSTDPHDEDEEADADMPELEAISDLEEGDDEPGEIVVEEEENVDEVAVEDANKLDKEEEKRSSAAEEEDLDSKSMLSADNRSVVSEQSSDLSAEAGGSATRTTAHALDEIVVEEQLMNESTVAEPPAVPVPPVKMYHDDVQVVQEMKDQFDRAAMSADEVCKALEVGKLPYNQNNSAPKVSSMTMICGFPKMANKKKPLQFEEEKAMESGNLSSTLQKLYMWEKKLLEELKVEEKIRTLYAQKYEERKSLYITGAENYKLEAADIVIRKLATKISVAIQVIKSISNNINKLRDEELWPQTQELIKGFMQMWHTMSECHQIQCHALSQARNIDSAIAAASFGEAQIDLVKQLELQLLDMTTSFVVWFNAQRSYASTLNEWLKKGVEYVPEVTEDGVPPFSPGRLGAPPVFTLCNNWATSMARISHMEAVGTKHAFASSVLLIWERQRSEWKHVMLADKDIGYLRWMERDEMSMRKVVDERKKKLAHVSSQSGISLSTLHDGVPDASLQSCMCRFLEAMETLLVPARRHTKVCLFRQKRKKSERAF
ncbi:hypothetical protein EJB05_47716, partial [Eragrostis curvula]